jgi:TetR/AcrR family transcriptional regulator, ethionamide resistance regulator
MTAVGYACGVTLLSKRQRSDSRGRETEQAFVNATRELLEEGAAFAELNVSRIAERAGRKRTSFYAYFDDRRVLLERLTDELATAMFEAAEGFFSGATDRPDIRRTLKEILDVFNSHPTVFRAVVEASGYDDDVAAYWRGIIDRLTDAAQRRIEESRGASRDEAHALAFALVWMTERTFYQHSVRGSGIDEAPLLDALTEVWLRAIQPT